MDKDDNAFRQARRALVLDHPFYGALVMHLEGVEDEKAKHGIWVNGRQVGFNPETLEDMPLGERAALLAKGVMQCALGHHARRGKRNAKLWNQASDLVINPEIRDSGLTLPKDCTEDRSYAGQSVEAVYRILEEEAQDEQDGGGSEGQNEGDGESGQQGGQPGQGDASGEVRDYPGDAPQDGQGDEDSDSQPHQAHQGMPQASEAEMQKQQEEWKVSMQQAMATAQARGKLPANMQRMVKEALVPKVSWKDATRRFMAVQAKDDMSWSRPNRRFIAQGLYLPAVHSEKLGTVVLVNDTSGSTQFAQAAFLSEMQAILEECNPERILYIQQDAAIASVEELEPGQEIPRGIHGGGGTDFRPVFAYLEQQDIEPACMIFLTDLDGAFPKEPSYPVLWASCSHSGHEQPPFGEVVQINEDKDSFY